MSQIVNRTIAGLAPLSREEQMETTGGYVWLVRVVVGVLINSAMNNIDDIREGFSDGYNDEPPRH